ncbi:hypothetical protein GCM10009616_18330 [Microlunatus lacustris]
MTMTTEAYLALVRRVLAEPSADDDRGLDLIGADVARPILVDDGPTFDDSDAEGIAKSIRSKA